MRKSIFVLSSIIFIGNAFCGPFGIDMGMSLEEVETVCRSKPIDKGEVFEINPPKPHPKFTQYIVRVSPSFGVYFLKAIGMQNTSIYGTELIECYNEIKSSLKKTYNECFEMNQLKTGSIWDEPRDFMMSIVKKERDVFSVWDNDSGSKMPSDINTVQLTVKAMSQEEGAIILDYFFSNYSEGKKEIEEEMESVF